MLFTFLTRGDACECNNEYKRLEYASWDSSGYEANIQWGLLLLTSVFQVGKIMFWFAWLKNCEREEKLPKQRCWHQR
jgi:hypothetical protein